ncbi:conserved hypothetical protein [uncultured delta proteobacterium]|uniref:RsbT co-antagonist protein RsbRD N-terminal domain-containing protein n=1 Tax=uncultured delta proteobacterium TaxID=34034 RepID=A0A212KEA4_9DELT|nr:conserved hypothetical protein [uncultured delta proteobacterium]
MRLAPVLENSCTPLIQSWITAANAIYPFATTGFLRSQQDPFANPVGRRSADLAPLLCRAVIGLPHDGAALRAALEEFVRVRAMQDLPAETSLEALFAYKGIIRASLKEQGLELTAADREELEAMDARCDSLALLAFGMYTRLRETFFEARVQDVRRRHSQILRLAERHGLAESVPEPDGGETS